MGSESKTHKERTKLTKNTTIRRSRRVRKKRLANIIKKLQESEVKNIEENRKVLINKNFMGN